MKFPSTVSQAEYARWVEPFYLQLMNANFLSLSPAERAQFADSLRTAVSEMPDDALERMLYAENWRPAKVAAWAIGVRQVTKFENAVGAELSRRPYHTEHLCICLAHLRSPAAADHLTAYLRVCLDPTRWTLQSEVLSPHWALAALERIDATSGGGPAAQFLDAGGPWELWVNDAIEIIARNGKWRRPPDPEFQNGWRKHWANRLDDTRRSLEAAMEFSQAISWVD